MLRSFLFYLEVSDLQLRLCSRCGRSTPNRPAVCDQCLTKQPERKREANRYYDTKHRDKRADEFYHGKEWKISRLAYLLSIDYLCEDCVEEFKRGERREEDIQLATDVHHKEPIETNWERRLDQTNYRGLCDCHHKRRRVRIMTRGGTEDSTGSSASTPQQLHSTAKTPQ